jgi:hypothetical protein
MSKKEEPSRQYASEQIVPRSIGQRRIEFHNCARILPTRRGQRHHLVLGRNSRRIDREIRVPNHVKRRSFAL